MTSRLPSVGDLPLPPNITLHTDPNESVILVTSQVVEEVEEEVELLDEDLEAEPELVEKGRREDEDGESVEDQE